MGSRTKHSRTIERVRLRGGRRNLELGSLLLLLLLLRVLLLLVAIVVTHAVAIVAIASARLKILQQETVFRYDGRGTARSAGQSKWHTL